MRKRLTLNLDPHYHVIENHSEFSVPALRLYISFVAYNCVSGVIYCRIHLFEYKDWCEKGGVPFNSCKYCNSISQCCLTETIRR